MSAKVAPHPFHARKARDKRPLRRGHRPTDVQRPSSNPAKCKHGRAREMCGRCEVRS